MNEQQEVTAKSAADPERESGTHDVGRSDLTLVPEVDIYEDNGGIWVLADMPGVSKDRLDIEVNKDALTIEGEAKIDMPGGIEALYADVRSTRYRRSFVLSAELDTENVDAVLKDGVLRIRIPKRDEAKPRKIEVSTA